MGQNIALPLIADSSLMHPCGLGLIAAAGPGSFGAFIRYCNTTGKCFEIERVNLLRSNYFVIQRKKLFWIRYGRILDKAVFET